MCKRKQACTDKFLATVSEGVVCGVYKVVTWLSFGVTRGHKVSGGKWTFRYGVTRSCVGSLEVVPPPRENL